jgi:hypothetical protein
MSNEQCPIRRLHILHIAHCSLRIEGERPCPGGLKLPAPQNRSQSAKQVRRPNRAVHGEGTPQNVDVSWGHEPERKHKGAAAFGVRRACSRFFARAKAPASRTHSKRFAHSLALGEHHGSWRGFGFAIANGQSPIDQSLVRFLQTEEFLKGQRPARESKPGWGY